MKIEFRVTSIRISTFVEDFHRSSQSGHRILQNGQVERDQKKKKLRA